MKNLILKVPVEMASIVHALLVNGAEVAADAAVQDPADIESKLEAAALATMAEALERAAKSVVYNW